MKLLHTGEMASEEAYRGTSELLKLVEVLHNGSDGLVSTAKWAALHIIHLIAFRNKPYFDMAAASEA